MESRAGFHSLARSLYLSARRLHAAPAENLAGRSGREVCRQSGEILQADKCGLVVGCGQQALRILSLQLEVAGDCMPRNSWPVTA